MTSDADRIEGERRASTIARALDTAVWRLPTFLWVLSALIALGGVVATIVTLMATSGVSQRTATLAVPALLLAMVSLALLILLIRALAERSNYARLAVTGSDMKADLRRYEQALWALCERTPRPSRYRTFRLIYEIGESPEEDSTTQIAEVQAADERLPLVFQRIDAGADRKGVPVKSSLRDLEAIGVYEDLGHGEERSLPWVSLGSRHGLLYGLVVFEHQIDITPRRWRFHYQWTGAWNPLRSEGVDQFRLHLLESDLAVYDDVRVSFVFPHSAANPGVVPRNSEAEQVPDVRRDLRGRSVIEFTLSNVKSREFVWDLRMERSARHRTP